MFIRRDSLSKRQNKLTTDSSDTEDAAFIRLVLIHHRMIAPPHILLYIRDPAAAWNIMYLNRKEMEVTESVVTMIKYHSWRLTGHQGPLTDTIRRERRSGEREREREDICSIR